MNWGFLAAALFLYPVVAWSAARPVFEQTAECRAAPDDAAWFVQAEESWHKTEARALKLAPGADPEYVIFDATCVWRSVLGTKDLHLVASPHHGAIVLPEGIQIPVAITSFAHDYDSGKKAFLVFSLPSVWRSNGLQTDLKLEDLVTGVFIHESTHTRQFAAFNPLIEAAEKRWNVSDNDLNDDMVQDRFSKNQEYVDSYKKEDELLFAAATEPDAGKARAALRQAWAMITERRAKWFTGADQKYADFEDIWLTMEGLAQWAAYEWLTGDDGPHYSRDFALKNFRRGGKYWSQDEGLAVFMAVDRFTPDADKKTFAAKPKTALELLEAAATSQP